MARYNYTASKQNGEIVEGTVEAGKASDVLNYLTSRDMKPVSVKPVSTGETGASKNIHLFGWGKINMEDQIFIFRYLALMLGIGTNLLRAINILIEDFEKSSVKNFLMEVRSNLEKGNPFYIAFSKYPKVFNDVHVNLIKAGEVSGNLEEVFQNITDALVKEKDLEDKIKNALIYPSLLLGISVIILVFLVTFALPKIANVFLESGFDPPIFSKIVFTVGLFLGKIWYLVIGGLVGAVVGFILAYKNSLFVQKLVWRMIIKVPVIREIVRKRALQRFASTASNLIKAGIPINRVLEITSEAASHVELKEALERVNKEGISKGLTLGEAFRREPFFPNVVMNLIAVAERAGHLENVLATLADFYITEVDNSIKRLISVLEPLLLLLIGAVIGVIALSIIVPIYQLTTQF
jgi:type IV pilus assembly protein PilC